MRESTAKAKGRNYLWYFLYAPMYNVVRAEEAEEIFQSTKLITKNVVYELIRPFLGDGLLISTETALGVKLDDMSEGNEYRKAIHAIEEVLIQRVCNPLMYYNWYFFLYGDYRKHAEKLRIVHDFSSRIIERKRQQFQQKQLGEKQRYAMLDTLLAAEAEGQIDHQGICDEVNTFMFEGYDTTSTCLIFTLLMLALHEDVQQRCYEEVENLPEDGDEISVFQFNELCVIKESLRMFPSVPFIGRQCVEESVVNGMVMPKDTQISIHIYDIMRDPRHFPKPNQFQPERFLPENTVNRHPFAFVPFSAESIFNFMRDACAEAKGRNYLWYFFKAPMYNVVRAEEAEEVFQSPKLITKNMIYDLLKPFLGEGLLTSTETALGVKLDDLTEGFRYRQSIHAIEEVMQQRLCNPFFYNTVYFYLFGDYRKQVDNLKIAHDFSSRIIEKRRSLFRTTVFSFMRESTAKAKGQNYVWYFLFAPEYNVVRAEEAEEIFQSTKLLTKNMVYELIRPFLGDGLLISTETALGVKLDDMSEGNEYRKAIYAFEEVLIQRVCNPLMYYDWYFFLFGNYRKHAEKLRIVHDFSSRIIERKRQQFQQKQLGEGYDTTSTCLIFTLLMLALHEDVQKRCFEEVENLPEDSDEITVFQFNKLVYLECVIKESLRMFPSVPFIGRECVEESVDTQISIHLYDIMRDPRHFPNPNQFEPERFLSENTVNRHPFAFVPFSAGQRNCIGQKFAILEMKVLLAAVIRNFKLLPAT
ncbi:hypothetical protein M5D96_004277, partial [Drosophila gunungcola]